MRSLERHKKIIKSIDTDLQSIKHDIILIDDYESLGVRADGLEDLFELWKAIIKHLLKNIKAKPAVDKGKGLVGLNWPIRLVFSHLTEKFETDIVDGNNSIPHHPMQDQTK